MHNSAENFRENVRCAIRYRDMTFSDLAEKAGIARPGLSRVVNGHQDATIGHAEKIAEAVRIPLTLLLSPPPEFQMWIRQRTQNLTTVG